MASINPTSVQCSPEQFTTNHGYIKLTITSISDSDATTNQRYIGWKLTVEGTSWTQLSAYYCSLGGQVLSEKYTNTSGWTSGQTLDYGTATFSNDSAGNLSLYAYVKQLFYYGYTASRWSNSNMYQDAGVTMYCSQLPRYANFTSHNVSTELNKINVSYSTDSNYSAQQYKLDGGSWTDCSAGSYSLSGFTPESIHTIQTRIQRADSGLWSESSIATVTMASLPYSSSISDVNFNSSGIIVDVSISSISYLSSWYIKLYDGNTLLRDGSDNPNRASSTSDYWMILSQAASEMLPRHSSDNKWTLTAKFYVVSNGTTYELTQREFTCTIPSGQYTPVFNTNNISYTVTDDLSIDITGSNQKVIKGISNITVNCTAASPQGGSSMKSYNATAGSKTASTTNLSNISMNLDSVDGSSVTVQAIDTRDRTTNATKAFTQYIDYSKVNISSSNITRYDGIGQNLVFNIVGSFYKWSGLAVNNSITAIQYQYKLKGQPDSSYSLPINITGITYSDNVFTVNSVSSGNHFDTDKEYTLKISITDRLTTVSYTFDIPTGKALVWKDLANYRIGIGKKPTETIDVQGNAKVSGTINGYTLDNVCELGYTVVDTW